VEYVPSMKTTKLLLINIVIAAFSFIILYFFDWPTEAVGIIGIAWAIISTVEAIRKRRKLLKRTIAHEVAHFFSG